MSHPEEPPITAYDLTDPGDRRKSFEDQCKTLRHEILSLDTQAIQASDGGTSVYKD